MLEAYGLSENVLPMAMNRIDRYRFGTVGVPLEGNSIRLDATGMVQVRGEGLFGGYLGDQNKSVTDADGYYTTGDIGSFDNDGFLRLLGRNGDLIKTSTGKRVAPAAVEARLCSVAGIDQAMLLGDGRKGLVALCTLDPAARDGARHERLIQDLRAEALCMNAFERPLAVLLIEQPFSIAAGDLTPNLKLRRAAIAARYAVQVESLYSCSDGKADDALTVVSLPQPAHPM